MIQHEEDVPSAPGVPLVERGEVLREAGAVLSATDDLDPSASPTLATAEDRHPPIHPDRGDPSLLTDAMPLLCEVRIRLDMRLILMVQFVPRGIRRSEEHTSELQSRQYLVCR